MSLIRGARRPFVHSRSGGDWVNLALAQGLKLISQQERHLSADSHTATETTAAPVCELVQCDRRMPWFRVLRGHNHVSPAMQINSEVDTLGPELLEFVRELV
ncbi:MAG: hypothetical protein A3H35_11790 [Betaproteobacteria bacterium RIFCSPLOWO2_02_FULL_62_17]|nr:MAG: hypothetical protein A3H35_11790 [Betaproteobacteria bacterium RIFCSPLOWO2_02_FULL_62_17]